MLYSRSLMANKFDWEDIYPAVRIPFKFDCELQIEAIMGQRPQATSEAARCGSHTCGLIQFGGTWSPAYSSLTAISSNSE